MAWSCGVKTTKRSCAACAFWDSSSEGFGLCRRLAPGFRNTGGAIQVKAVWPETAASDWCALFKPGRGSEKQAPDVTPRERGEYARKYDQQEYVDIVARLNGPFAFGVNNELKRIYGSARGSQTCVRLKAMVRDGLLRVENRRYYPVAPVAEVPVADSQPAVAATESDGAVGAG